MTVNSCGTSFISAASDQCDDFVAIMKLARSWYSLQFEYGLEGRWRPFLGLFDSPLAVHL